MRIEHRSKTHGNGVRALDDVSLTMPQGMYGLLGPNEIGVYGPAGDEAARDTLYLRSTTCTPDSSASPSPSRGARRRPASIHATY